jgi:hypothetical protein
MSRKTMLALPLTLLAVGTVGLAAAAPASAGGRTACSFSRTTTAQVSSVDLPDPVRAGSSVSATVTIDRLPENTGPVELKLLNGSWTRTNLCVTVPAGASSANFDVDITPVTSDGEYATVGAYATPDGADVHYGTSLIVRR